MLLGTFVPFAGDEQFSFSLSDNNSEIVILIAISALLCIGGGIGEFFGLREGLLAGIGIATGFTFMAVAVLVAVPVQTDLSPRIGYVLWLLAVFVGIALMVVLLVEIQKSSDRDQVPTAFWACCLGGGLLLTVGVLIPDDGVSFADHIVTGTPALALVNVLYALVPTIAAVAALVSPRRFTLTVIVGIVIWFATSWMVSAHSSQAVLLGGNGDPGISHYVQLLAILILGLAAIGGSLVRWVGGSPTINGTRELVLPIAATSALVLMVLYGLIAGF